MLSSYAFLVGVQSGALGRGAAIAHPAVPDPAGGRVLRAARAAAEGHLSAWPPVTLAQADSAAQRAGGTSAKRVPVYGGLTFYAVLAGLPIYWMIITTFKPDRDLYNLQNFPLWFNQNGVTLDHLALLFNRTSFNTWLKNTVCGRRSAVVAITLARVGPGRLRPGAAALPRRRVADHRHLPDLPGADHAAVPAAGQGDLVPGLFDKLQSLILAYPTFTIPFCTWLMAGFFKTIPFEIEEAAMVDGCSRLGADPARHPAAQPGRHADRRDLRVHAEHAGLRLRADVRVVVRSRRWSTSAW